MQWLLVTSMRAWFMSIGGKSLIEVCSRNLGQERLEMEGGVHIHSFEGFLHEKERNKVVAVKKYDEEL